MDDVMTKAMTLTDIPGILVGHASDPVNRTGCTAVLCPEGAVTGLDVRGHAPGTRETDLLAPTARVDRIHGLLLTGGSAFGLVAASGVFRWLAEHGFGLPTLFARVPLVPAAVIYDLNFHQTLGKPDEAMGYQAAEAASDDPVSQGCVGAGTGATAGKLAGFDRAMKSGLGSAGMSEGDILVAALAVANPVGDVIDPDTGEILAGVRTPDGRSVAGAMSVVGSLQSLIPPPVTNTVLAVVATNACLDKVQVTRVARMASAGLARSLRPAHSIFDGDVLFAMATGTGPAADESLVGALGAEVVGRAVAAGAREAASVPGFPAYRDMVRDRTA